MSDLWFYKSVSKTVVIYPYYAFVTSDNVPLIDAEKTLIIPHSLISDQQSPNMSPKCNASTVQQNVSTQTPRLHDEDMDHMPGNYSDCGRLGMERSNTDSKHDS